MAASGSAAGPSEDEKALMELQDRMLMGQQALSRLNTQERVANSRKARTELMLSELKAMPDNTKTYKSVGKAYFLAPKADITTEAETAVQEISTEIDSCRTQRGVVEQKLKETETELRELIRTHPEIIRQLGAAKA